MYDHTQKSYVLLSILAIIYVFVATVISISLMQRDMSVYKFVYIHIILWIVIIGIGLLFSSLRVVVTDDAIFLSFRGNLFKRTYQLSNIQSATSVRYPWWYGWGIRITPQGMLYSVAGLQAIKLELKDGRYVLIGTDDSENLANTIHEKLGNGEA